MSVAVGPVLDTNILVYLHDRQEPQKATHARTIVGRVLGSTWPTVSTQVLAEFYWTATRKLRPALTHDEARQEIRRLCVLTRVIPVTQLLVEQALDAVERYQMPLWDAQIFAAASEAGSEVVLSEDFQHRRRVGSVTFLNPFAPDFDIAEVLPP